MKKIIVLISLILLTIWFVPPSQAIVSTNYKLGDIEAIGRYVDANSRISLIAARDSIGYSARKRLVINRVITLWEDTNMPENIDIEVTSGGRIDRHSNQTFISHGNFYAGRYACFGDSNDNWVILHKVEKICPEWWGGIADGVVDNTSALIRSIECASSITTLSNGGVVQLDYGKYLFSSTITLPSYITILGRGRKKTYLHYTGTGYGLETDTTVQTIEIRLHGFTLSGTSSADGGIYLGSATNFCGHYLLKDIETTTSFSKSTAVGVFFDNPSHGSCRDCIFNGGGYGISFTASAINTGVWTFDNCHIGNSTQDTVGNCTGCRLNNVAGEIDSLVFNGCYFSGTAATSCLILDGPEGIIFNGCHFEVSADSTYNLFVTQLITVINSSSTEAVFNNCAFGSGGTPVITYIINIESTNQGHEIVLNSPFINNIKSTGAIWNIPADNGNGVYEMTGWKTATTTPSIHSGGHGYLVKLKKSNRLSSQSASDDTPSVAGIDQLLLSGGIPTIITDLDDGYWGQVVQLIGNDYGIAINDGGNFRLKRDWQSKPEAIITLINRADTWYEASRSDYYYSSVPTSGTWPRGDIIINPSPSAGGSPGWVCVSSGTFSLATETGDTDGLTATITNMLDTSDFSVGDYVTVSGGFPSATTPYQITAVTSTSITLDTNSTSAVVGVTVDTPDPVFKAMANLAT